MGKVEKTNPASVSGSDLISYKFDFGNRGATEGFQEVSTSSFYNPEVGFGLVSKDAVQAGSNAQSKGVKSDFLTSESPFYFALDLPEGNYKVSITFGNEQESTTATVKAESRRLMLHELSLLPGEFLTETIVVNRRSPKINKTDSIRLKPREYPYLNWDNKLTLEFGDENPSICAIEITEVIDIPTIFLAGNSTMVDQENEPWASWGQMVPTFFKNDIVVANFAESGESLRSFVGEKRLQKVMSKMKEGDYLFIEFAHNDQKAKGPHEEVIARYKESLKMFIQEAREKGATPVLVTSMHRRNFDEHGKIKNTLEDFPETMRQTAAEEHIALIDLNEMSKLFYEAMGPEDSKKAFVHYPAGTFEGQAKDLADNTHFNTYGAHQLAKCIVEGIKANVPELAMHLKEGIPTYNPAEPDSFESFNWPLSPTFEIEKPDGN
ncbi:rhamnogalacturonan acetylesterase [Flammeovirgaceae bacterium SG7u.111]|nr:rhamnogalacturonan acetylesterase [Flammeovirgaceae bacterium SG7u.132]WPO37903.1 rhamnogalacturonan acetylesterase [Flammeovirgaceae bacterium SG7u.111]